MRDIVIGRSPKDTKELGKKGAVYIGKQFIKMGDVFSLSNNVYLDVSGAHVMLICGKRGGGKSYTMGAIAEGLADMEPSVKKNISIILVDVMGVYWTMKYPNKREELMLKGWGLEPKALDVKIYTPEKHYYKYKEKGIPTDFPFSVKPSEMSSKDWCKTFSILDNTPEAVLIERCVNQTIKLKEDYDIDDILNVVKNDVKAQMHTKDVVANLFENSKNWGVFSNEGKSLSDLAVGGQVSVLDLSCYATTPGGWEIKAMVLGLLAQKMFIYRMGVRKNEEYEEIKKNTTFFSKRKVEDEMPLVWLVIDEAHEFLPREGEVMSTKPLVTIMREGRQPGISLILATQQPGKIHTDVMTQSDIVLSHRITAKLDTDSLKMLTQSYMSGSLDKYINEMPREKGSAVIFDDNNERIYPLKIRPRFTWHGGMSADAIKKED